MRTSLNEPDPRAHHVTTTDEDLIVDLVDGRRLSVPLGWFPRLHGASEEERRDWVFLGDGRGIRWPRIDEDLSVAGLLRGTPAPGTRRPAA